MLHLGVLFQPLSPCRLARDRKVKRAWNWRH
jgi:hypothetical protein